MLLRSFHILTALSEAACKGAPNGRVIEIPRRDVVVDDIVLIEVGDEVPADRRPALVPICKSTSDRLPVSL